MSSDFLNHPEYISLKEASELSGYHADHVGRLIRRGLLYGKRTPRGWVTTRTALTHYARGKVELAKLSPILASADFDTSGALAPEPSRGMELRGAQQAIGVVAPKENTGVAVQSLSEVRHVKTGTSLFSRIALLIGAPVVGVGLALGIIVILGQSSVADGIGAFANRVLDAFDGVPAAQPVADGNGSALEKIAQTLEELGANVEQLATREPETIVQEVSRTTNEVTQQVTNVTQENVVRDVTDGQIATAVEKLLLEGIVVPGTSDFSGANVDRLSVEDNLAVSGTISAPTFKGGGLIVDHAELSGNLTVEGITDFNGSVTLGDTLSTITIASSTWNVTAAGAASGFTELTVDNLKMDGNTLSSLTSGGVTISPLAGESVSVALSTTGNFVVNTDDLVVDTDTGNVGIGLTAPGEELTLASTYSLGWDNGAGTADVTLYRSAANTLKTDDLFVVNNDLSVTGDLEVLGITTTAGNVDLGDTVVDTITFIGVVDSNIIPVSSSAYDLGSASLRWDNGYFDSITANTLTGVVVGGATSAEDWTINSDNATPNEELSTLSFETGTGSFNAVMQWNASGDAGRVSGFDNTLLFNYPIAFYSQVSGPNQTFTSGTLFSYSQPLAHAITQSGAFTGINVDFSSNITNTTGNQTGIAITLKDGSVSGTTTGLTLSGTADYGIDLTSATIGTAAITLPVGTAAAQGITFGADTNLYRSAADTLKTDDSLVVGGSLTISAGSTVLTSSSTTADNKTLSVSQTGATVGTDYAGYFANTGAATTNVGLYATATGATNNYAAIFEAGSVGIGTTTPTSFLHVDGAATTTVLSTFSRSMFDNTNAITTNTGNTQVFGLAIDEPNITVGTATPTNSASLYVSGAATEATNNYALWVDGGESRFDGNVGIGTTDPDSLLVLSATSPDLKIITSANSNYGRLNRTTTQLTQYNQVYKPGGNSSLSFSSASSQSVNVTVASGALRATTAVTVSTWVNRTSGSGQADIVSFQDYSGAAGYRMWFSNGTTICFGVAGTGGAGAKCASTGISQGSWHHIAAVYNGSTIQLYTDGSANGTAGAVTTTSMTYSQNNFRIGGFSAADIYYLDANIDDPRVYARALDSSEIATLSDGNEPSSTSLAGEWKFNEGTGSSAADASGNGFTATLTNSPTWDSDIPAENPAPTDGVYEEIPVYIAADGGVENQEGILTFGWTNGRSILRGDYTTFQYGASDTEAMRISSSGLVGIGTTTPTSFLHVDGAATTTVLSTFSRSMFDNTNAITTNTGNTQVFGLAIDEPNITVGTATPTNSASLYVSGAATEATNNYALWVDGGKARLDGRTIIGTGGNDPGAAQFLLSYAEDIDSSLAGTTRYGLLTRPVFPAGLTGTAVGIQSAVQTSAAVYTLSSGMSFRAANASIGAGSTLTTQYGLYIDDQTSGASDYGIAIEGADTAALWISSAADTTDAANGISFGASRDTNLYRSAANVLKTDDGFIAAGTITAGTSIIQMVYDGSKGLLQIGDGGGTYDTNLYRFAADTLKTDDSLTVGTALSVTQNGHFDTSDGGYSLDFGSAADIGLWRSATRTLRIGDPTSSKVAAEFTAPASGSGNYIKFTGVAAGSAPTLTTAGGDTAVSLSIIPKSTGSVQITSGVTTGTTTSSGLSLSANSVTSGTAAYISATGLTSGKVLDIDATYAPSDGPTNTVFDMTVTNAPTVSADNVYSFYHVLNDNTALANTVNGVSSVIGLQGNAAKSGRAISTYFTDTSTTGDTLMGMLQTGGASGALAAGQTRAIYGVDSAMVSTAATAQATATLNMYGGYFAPSSTLATAGTDNIYGLYTTTTATHAADAGTVNQYGLYVDNGTSSTNGTSTKYGIYINNQTGGDNNYALVTSATAGNVGIGTTAPAYLLDIQATNAMDALVISPTTGTNTSSMRFHNTGNDFYLGLDNSAGSQFQAASAHSTYAGSLYLGSARDLIFYTNAAERMTILSGGNVGIGTTTPGAKLEISGSAALSGSIRQSWSNWSNYVQYPDAYTTSPSYAMGWSSDATNRALYIDNLIGESPTGVKNSIQFRNGNGSLTTKMIIDFNGNVGIGTTTPGAALHVVPSGTTNVSGALIAGAVNRSSGGTAQAVSALKLTTALTPENNGAAPGRSIYGLYANLGTMTAIGAATNHTFADIAITPATINLNTGTVANHAGLYIDSAPAGATNNYSVWVDSGTTRLDGSLDMSAVTSGSAGFGIGIAPSTSISVNVDRITGNSTRSAEYNFASFENSGFQLTGNISDQRNVVLKGSTFTGDVATRTITNYATLYVAGAGTAGANAAITNNYALWVDAGTTRLDGSLRWNALGTSSQATLHGGWASSGATVPTTTFSAVIETNSDQDGLSFLQNDEKTVKITFGGPTNNLSGYLSFFNSATAASRKLALSASGSDQVVLTNAGQLQVPTTGSTAGLLIGGDANLYRSAADTLKTDDDFVVAGTTGLTFTGTGGQINFTNGETIDNDTDGQITMTAGILDLQSYAPTAVNRIVVGNSYESTSTAYGIVGTRFQSGSSNANSIIGVSGNGHAYALGLGNTLAWAKGVVGVAGHNGGTNSGTVTNAASLYASAVWANGGGTTTTGYGLYVEDQTAATNDYGIAIAGADTAALWISSGADNTDAANGIAFGASRDTQLYRGAANRLDLASGDSLSIVSGSLGIGTAPSYTLDIISPDGQIGLLVGDLTTDAARKDFRAGSRHYTNSEEPVALFFAANDSVTNTLAIGGGTNSFNATTDIVFYTAANNATVVGTAAGTFNGNGRFTLPVTGVSAGLLIGGDTQLYRSAANTLSLASGDSLYVESGQVRVRGTGGHLIMLDKTDNGVDEKKWDFAEGATTFLGRAMNDAENSTSNWLTVTRSGMTISSIDLAATTVSVSGSGGLSVGVFSTANTTAVCWDNAGASLLYDCNGSATDLAELYGTADPSIEAADIVVSSGEAESILDPNEGGATSRAYVAKSTTPYEGTLIGVISTNPNQVYGDDGVFAPQDNPRPVSLAGRVPVKVSTENGPIRTGDAITSSSTPGVGMRATQEGRIVGIALSSYENTDPTAVGAVTVFVNTSYHDPTSFFVLAENATPLSIPSQFSELARKVYDAILEVPVLIASFIQTDQIEVTNPYGITVYDTVTGEPHCVVSENGVLKSLPGICADASNGVQQPAPQPAIEPSPEPAAVVEGAPVAEPIVESAAEPVVEPVSEPTIEPTVELTPEPAPAPEPSPSPEPVVDLGV